MLSPSELLEYTRVIRNYKKLLDSRMSKENKTLVFDTFDQYVSVVKLCLAYETNFESISTALATIKNTSRTMMSIPKVRKARKNELEAEKVSMSESEQAQSS